MYLKLPVETMLANIVGLSAMFDLARARSVRRLLYISSSEVYGQKEGMNPYAENDFGYLDILNQRAGYPSSKRAGESLCVAYGMEYGIDSVIVRPGHIYGPSIRSSDNRVSAEVTRRAVAGDDVILRSRGDQLRSYCYSLDCASAILTVLLRGERDNAYNISNPHSICTVRELAEAVARAASVNVRFDIPESAESGTHNLMVNSSLASEKLEALGWTPVFDLERGVDRMMAVLKDARGSVLDLARPRADPGPLTGMPRWTRERHHPRRRLRHATAPDHAGRLEAADPGVRQADGLLPAVDADARRHPRHPDHHDAARRDQFFERLLGDGSQFGVTLTFAQQPSPDGLAQAFTIGADFIGDDKVALVLGDNLLYGPGLGTQLKRYADVDGGAVFAYWVAEPTAYGVVEFDADGPGRLARGEARRSRRATTRFPACTSTTTTSSRSPGACSPARAASTRSPTSTAPTSSAASCRSRCCPAARPGWTPARSIR